MGRPKEFDREEARDPGLDALGATRLRDALFLDRRREPGREEARLFWPEFGGRADRPRRARRQLLGAPHAQLRAHLLRSARARAGIRRAGRNQRHPGVVALSLERAAGVAYLGQGRSVVEQPRRYCAHRASLARQSPPTEQALSCILVSLCHIPDCLIPDQLVQNRAAPSPEVPPRTEPGDLLLYRPGQGPAWVVRSNGNGTFATVYPAHR